MKTKPIHYLVVISLICALSGFLGAQPPAHTLNDPTRPIYHLVSQDKRSHIADPNFAFYWKGRYHLYFIAARNPVTKERNFAHVSSTDMVNWKYHRETNFGGLSGTLFLSPDGVPTIIGKASKQITLHRPLDDQLEHWELLTEVVPTFGPGQDGKRMSEKHWDPDAWVEGNTTYILITAHPLSPKGQPALFKTTDMKTFHFVDYFLDVDVPGVARTSDIKTNDDLSCPSFFPIGNKWMMLCISHNKGCRYYLGDWKDEKFIPDYHGWMNWHKGDVDSRYGHGGDVFAPESLLAPDGRRVMWAWLFAQSKVRVSPNWQEVLSLPRELSLPEDGVLRIQPLRELEQLRYNLKTEKNIRVEAGTPYRLKKISGDTMELMLTISQGEAERYGVKILCDSTNGKGLDVVVDPKAKILQVGVTRAPLELKEKEEIQLRIFIDRSVVEVFANDRQAVAWQHVYELGDAGVCLFSEGGAMEVPEVKAWDMKAALPEVADLSPEGSK